MYMEKLEELKLGAVNQSAMGVCRFRSLQAHVTDSTLESVKSCPMTFCHVMILGPTEQRVLCFSHPILIWLTCRFTAVGKGNLIPYMVLLDCCYPGLNF